jgi:hypothetical protein
LQLHFVQACSRKKLAFFFTSLFFFTIDQIVGKFLKAYLLDAASNDRLLIQIDEKKEFNKCKNFFGILFPV